MRSEQDSSLQSYGSSITLRMGWQIMQHGFPFLVWALWQLYHLLYTSFNGVESGGGGGGGGGGGWGGGGGLGWGSGATGFTLFVHLSVCRWKRVSALYLPQYSPDPFHFCTFYPPTSEGVPHVDIVWKYYNLNFCRNLLLQVVRPTISPWPIFLPMLTAPPMSLTLDCVYSSPSGVGMGRGYSRLFFNQTDFVVIDIDEITFDRAVRISFGSLRNI